MSIFKFSLLSRQSDAPDSVQYFPHVSWWSMDKWSNSTYFSWHSCTIHIQSPASFPNQKFKIPTSRGPPAILKDHPCTIALASKQTCLSPIRLQVMVTDGRTKSLQTLKLIRCRPAYQIGSGDLDFSRHFWQMHPLTEMRIFKGAPYPNHLNWGNFFLDPSPPRKIRIMSLSFGGWGVGGG